MAVEHKLNCVCILLKASFYTVIWVSSVLLRYMIFILADLNPLRITEDYV